MKFHQHLYLGATLKNPLKIRRQLKTGRGLLADIFVIAIAPDPDQLEFYDARFLCQKKLRRSLYIVGLAKGRDEAQGLVEQIVKDCYAQTGAADLKKFLLKNETR
jgi:hypothetical protein